MTKLKRVFAGVVSFES